MSRKPDVRGSLLGPGLLGLGLLTLAVTAAPRWALADSPAPAAQSASTALRSSSTRVKAFAQLPNWSGFWEQYDIGASGTPDPSKVKQASAGPRPLFTESWLARMSTESKHNPQTDRVCTFGFPWLLESSPLIFEILSVPEETAMIFNMREVRHLYTDGKGHTPEDVRLVTPWGDSVGHWEGDSLLVETVATSGRLWFRNEHDQPDSTVLSDQAVYRERLRMLDANTLEDSFTVEDPVALQVPYRFERRYHRIAGMTRVVEELDCEASGTNDRNPIVNGKWTLAPAKP
jgi:hypothetical protein